MVTNAPAIGELMIEANDNKVILTGGELLKETKGLIGSAAEQSLKQYRTDKAIIGVSGILVDEGCFSAIPQEGGDQASHVLQLERDHLVSDSSKIGARAFAFSATSRTSTSW